METKQRLAFSAEKTGGGTPWNKGLSTPEDVKRKISESKKGQRNSKNTEFKKGAKPWNKGIPRTEETKRKISEANKGKKLSKEIKEKISKRNKGRTVSEETRRKISKTLNGHKVSKESREKMSSSRRGKYVGAKAWNWRGGKKGYPSVWSETLRRSIRERDNYVCAICKDTQGDQAFDVHHIDYDKENCNPYNLRTLCHSCHSKTGINRKYWTEYFSHFFI
jgi:5-methylcytosine-specific restriction endonuclease McrA